MAKVFRCQNELGDGSRLTESIQSSGHKDCPVLLKRDRKTTVALQPGGPRTRGGFEDYPVFCTSDLSVSLSIRAKSPKRSSSETAPITGIVTG
jgi:hypothetical protein